ncbi:MAG: DUF2125 domain-containing protein [Sulfitobacter sp.]|nr:DUF2125 domain-containing protein [Sulfitobacter sp.]
MPRIAFRPLCLALPISLLSQAAFADLTPAQVWGDWRQYMEGMGYSVQATETAGGGNLTISDLEIGFQVPDEEGTMTMSFGTLSFEQMSDGSVAIVMPAAMPLSVTGSDRSTDESFTMNMTYAQTGHSVLVSGTSEEMTYDYNADTFALTLNELIVEDEVFGAENAKLSVAGTGFGTSTLMSKGDTRGYEQTGSIDNLTYDIFINDPDDTAQVSFAGGITGVEVEGGGTLPLQINDSTDMAAMMRAGFDVAGLISYGSGNTQINVVDPQNGNFAAQTSTAGGALSLAMSAEGLVYEVGQSNLAMTLNVADLPFPIQFSMEEGEFSVAMPVAKSDMPQNFAFGLTLANFVMSDMIWGIFDPAGQLPRDAATLDVDMSGTVRLDVDLLDPQAAGRMGQEAPGQVESLTISTLVLDAVGARLEGSGDVTFDNSDFQTVPGMPKPVGQLNLSLAGANALIDKLVAMGLLPDEEAMGARMMMGLFAVPGAEPDTLNSRVEFTDEGQILANGQRIK